MPIQATITKQPESSIKLDINIDAVDVKKAYDETYAELSQKIKVKGFRPGKVPASVIKMKYGSSVSHEVMDNLLNTAFRQAIKDNDLHPVSRGDIAGDLPELKEDQPYKFSMTVDVYPEFELPEYLELPVTKDTYEIKDKDIQSELDSIAERFATIETVEDGKVEKESLVTLSYEVEFKGEIIDNLSRDNQSYDQSVGSEYPNLKKGLLGLTVGDKAEIKSTFPKEFPDEEKAGKDVLFKITVKSIQKRVIPELDDAFAKKISQDDDLQTMEDFRNMLVKNMEEHARHRESRAVQNEIVNQLNKAISTELPKSMIESEVNSLLSNLKNEILHAKITFEQFLESNKKTEEQVKTDFIEPAKKQIITTLALSEIAKKEGIIADENEIKGEVAQLAAQYRASFEDTYKHLAEHGEIDSLAFNIQRRKTLDFLESKAKIKKGKTIAFSELTKN